MHRIMQIARVSGSVSGRMFHEYGSRSLKERKKFAIEKDKRKRWKMAGKELNEVRKWEPKPETGTLTKRSNRLTTREDKQFWGWQVISENHHSIRIRHTEVLLGT